MDGHSVVQELSSFSPRKPSDSNPDLSTFLLKYLEHKVFIKYLHMH